MKSILKNAGMTALLLLAMTALNVNAQQTPGAHPAYLHALSDLRAARWMLNHRPGNWKLSGDEVQAVKQIDMAIGEIKKASLDDGKSLNWHPKVDEKPDHQGRLHEANEFLGKAHQDVNKEEDNNFAKGLKKRALQHIDAAKAATEKALKQ